uniref:Uncharacterized protein n=1 Tax=Avena sativa TaxID=4498 RepID=A0ACD5TLF9_AVESA
MDRGVTPESGRIERGKLRPGDHIYTWRTQQILFGLKIRLYAHHGIYESDDKVIQLTWTKVLSSADSEPQRLPQLPEPRTSTVAAVYPAPAVVELCLGSSMKKKSCPRCGQAKRRGDLVVSCLDCFLGTGSGKDELCLFAYAVTKSFYDESCSLFRLPTCSMEAEDPAEKVLRRANDLLDNGGTRTNYNLLDNNCFHLAFYCKTGKDYHRPVALSVEISMDTWEELLDEPQPFIVAVKKALQTQTP